MRPFVITLTAFIAFSLQARAASLSEPSRNVHEVIAVLIECLDDPDVEVRQNIALALGNIGEAATPALIAALSDSRRERRMGAATALGAIRPAAQSAVPALLHAMKDKDEGVRRHVSYALSRVVGRERGSLRSERVPPLPPLDPTPAANGDAR